MYSRVDAALAVVGFTDAVGVWREQRRCGMKKLLPKQKLARPRSALSDGRKGQLAGGGWFDCCGVCEVQGPGIEEIDANGNQARRGTRFGIAKMCVSSVRRRTQRETRPAWKPVASKLKSRSPRQRVRTPGMPSRLRPKWPPRRPIHLTACSSVGGSVAAPSFFLE
jgi:hypothetical protein